MIRSKARRRGIAGRLGPVAVSILLLVAGPPAASVAGAEQGIPLPRSGQQQLASDVPREKIAVTGNLTSSDFTSTDQVIVRWSDATPSGGGSSVGAEPARVARVTAAAGEQATWLRALAVGGDVYRFNSRLSPERIAATVGTLRGQPGVASIEPDQIVQSVASPPNDPYWTTPAPGQWDLSEGTTPTTYGIDLLGAWDTALGAGVVVAVIDTGITTHPDLAGQTVAGYDFIGDTLVANDGNGRDADPSDPGDWITTAENLSGYFAGCPVSDSSWHGTHVSGTIAALTNNAIGIAGIAPSAKIQPVRVLGKCGGYVSDIADAIVWASGGTVSGVPANATPARVINMSLGGPASCDSSMQAAIDGAVSRGTVVAVAAGNSNADASGFNPASCAGVITVAATDRAGARASFSNYGSVVEIAAPGVSLWSTLNAGTTVPTTPTYAQYSGTSMATPHIAGVAALMLAANSALTPAQVTELMQVTAHPLAAGGCPPGCGSGIVDAAQAVSAAVLPGFLRVTSSPALPAQISLNGVIADSWGLNWLELPPGDYTVHFSHVEGFSEPADQVVTVTAGATTTVTGTFTQRGSLRVTTSPAVAGQISVDGIPRNNWGMWTDLPTGAHQVCFGPLAGYTAPTCQNITVNAGALTSVTGTYTVSP